MRSERQREEIVLGEGVGAVEEKGLNEGKEKKSSKKRKRQKEE